MELLAFKHYFWATAFNAGIHHIGNARHDPLRLCPQYGRGTFLEDRLLQKRRMIASVITSDGCEISDFAEVVARAYDRLFGLDLSGVMRVMRPAPSGSDPSSHIPVPC